MSLRQDAEFIMKEAVQRVLPDEAVSRALQNWKPGEGDIYVVAVGKAAWQMCRVASETLDGRIKKGVVITKYAHVKGKLPRIHCYEAGHPIPDENSFAATRAALKMVENLNQEDIVLFLLSGGGSALFEKPLVDADELADITEQLLACGADIREINTIRKRLSAVKSGRFADFCKPARVFSIVLSDVLGDQLDMIGSGPTYPDPTTCADALSLVKKYQLDFSDRAMELLHTETPKALKHVETVVVGSVKELCRTASEACRKLGYEQRILTDQLDCEAREAGAFMAAIARTYQFTDKSLAFIAGGETVVHLIGKGKGGRNQELALSAARGIAGLKETAVFSIGSDGTDGPTDAAGGYCDGQTRARLLAQGIEIYDVLQENDAYYALEKVDGLIRTGATGTNVNDVSVLLIKR